MLHINLVILETVIVVQATQLLLHTLPRALLFTFRRQSRTQIRKVRFQKLAFLEKLHTSLLTIDHTARTQHTCTFSRSTTKTVAHSAPVFQDCSLRKDGYCESLGAESTSAVRVNNGDFDSFG